jgi:hypothetical protein
MASPITDEDSELAFATRQVRALGQKIDAALDRGDKRAFKSYALLRAQAVRVLARVERAAENRP